MDCVAVNLELAHRPVSGKEKSGHAYRISTERRPFKPSCCACHSWPISSADKPQQGRHGAKRLVGKGKNGLEYPTRDQSVLIALIACAVARRYGRRGMVWNGCKTQHVSQFRINDLPKLSCKCLMSQLGEYRASGTRSIFDCPVSPIIGGIAGMGDTDEEHGDSATRRPRIWPLSYRCACARILSAIGKIPKQDWLSGKENAERTSHQIIYRIFSRNMRRGINPRRRRFIIGYVYQFASVFIIKIYVRIDR